MKKRYELPCVCVVSVAKEDIIRTSLLFEEDGVAPIVDMTKLKKL